MKTTLPALLFIVIALAGAPAHPANSLFSEFVKISAHPEKLGPSEGIYGFTLDTMGAVILRTKVPFQWNLDIDSSEGGRSHLRAQAIVGSSAIRSSDFAFFDGFVEVAKFEDQSVAPPFDLKLVLKVTDDRTGKERKIVLPLHGLIMTRVSEP